MLIHPSNQCKDGPYHSYTPYIAPGNRPFGVAAVRGALALLTVTLS